MTTATDVTLQDDLSEVNALLKDQPPSDTIRWAIEQSKRPILTTNFGPHEAAILHMATQIEPNIPVVCVDTGYNTTATYQMAEQLTKRLKLNIHYYTPRVTKTRRDAVMGGIPSIDNPEAHDVFTREVKLEPFERAMSTHKPDVWLTAIRKEQTPFRDSLDIVTRDIATRCLKVAPIFYWSEVDLEEYLVEHDLPIEDDYFDPTKVLSDRECGLHIGK